MYISVRRWVEYFSTEATDLNDKHFSGRPPSAATRDKAFHCFLGHSDLKLTLTLTIGSQT